MSDTIPVVQRSADSVAWLEGRYHADLEPIAERAIRAAGLAWQDEPEAKRQLALAASIAPDHMAVLIAHYRYNLYKHDYLPAETYAARILAALAHRLGIAADWQQVASGDTDFASDNPDIRSWLFVLQAYGYVLLRLGRRDQAMAALRRIVALDTGDQTKTRALLRVIERAGKDD
jgi:hypothetical protein